ncbi:hypothetical protein J4460_02250 [Candidatus Woesearchaeota archaeon]|nr:MAG: hypothetical protein QS99_C0004G0016 [archaeon GW2011_AR4]MBS3129474.1 hypothetical protein [Candidatus Woesearchaeota archaeon]HIH38906.1 hypothetical protein [Candidatus Woesearchaeota archaeon]HIH49676.1 hypothetical protein [Candidatus Woesearchaeota archaeon]HIJ03761.1 hypothetical protein [Candidatus Woesearchaeota archaeon]
MKHRITITVDERTISRMQEAMRGKSFRNRSHLVEYAVQSFLEEEQ